MAKIVVSTRYPGQNWKCIAQFTEDRADEAQKLYKKLKNSLQFFTKLELK